MTDDLFIIIGLFNVLMYSYILTRNKHLTIILTVLTILATTLGLFFEEMYLTDYRISKRYMTLLFLLGYIKLGNVRGFRVVWWEFLLIAFYLIRLFIDLLRPDFELRGMFGGIGDGVFLTATYFFFKKTFIKNPKQIEIVLKIFIYFGICFAFIGIIEYIMRYDIFETEKSRFIVGYHQRSNSVFTSPEIFGLFSTISIYVSILLVLKNMISKTSFYFLLSIYLISLFMCLYRGIWIGFIVGGIVMYSIILLRNEYKIRLLVITVSLVITLGFSFYAVTHSFNKGSFYSEKIRNVQSIEDRIKIYRELAQGISDHFWVGNGTATVKEYLQSLGLDRRVGSRRTTTVHPHNAILTILFENGIFMLVIYICWFGFLLLPYRSLDIYAYSISSATIIGVLIAGMGLCLLPRFGLPYFIMVILAAYNMSFYEKDRLVDNPFSLRINVGSERG